MLLVQLPVVEAGSQFQDAAASRRCQTAASLHRIDRLL
jgi:hypothetical protein